LNLLLVVSKEKFWIATLLAFFETSFCIFTSEKNRLRRAVISLVTSVFIKNAEFVSIANLETAVSLGAIIITGTPLIRYSESLVGIESLEKIKSSSLKERGMIKKSYELIA
jgi:hypothetical protein